MFLIDLLVVYAVAGVVVYLAQRLHLPSVVGLLAAGVMVGPTASGVVADPHVVHVLAEVGVVVLLFTVGLEFSLSRLVAMGRLMLGVGVPQVAFCILATAALTWGPLGGWRPAVFAGMLVAMSSTAVVIKLLADRGELNAPHGRVSVAVLLFQDLLVVAFVLAVPLLAPGADGGGSVAVSLLAGLGAVAAVLLAGKFALPRVLYAVVRTRNRELFLIAIVVTVLGTAALTGAVGLSLALGAFLAGLTLSESEYGHQTLAEVLPFRDTLSSLFFVSVGMLLDVRFLAANLAPVAGIVAAVVGVKFLSVAVPAWLARGPFRPAFVTAFALAQVGEFSFVLAETGRAAGLLADAQYQLFLAAAVVTMALTPFLVAAGPRAADALAERPWFARAARLDRTDDLPGFEHPPGHVVIAGYGFNGRNLAAALKGLNVPYVVLETNPELVRARRAAGEPMLYGDSTRPAVLEHAGVGRARVFAVAISDPASTRRAVHLARRLNPGLRIVVRTRYQAEVPELHRLGADEVVPEEFETSVEVLGRVLRELGEPPGVIRRLADGIRADGYAAFAGAGFRLPADVHAATETDTCRVAGGAVGQTIGQLRVRTRTGASVIAVRRPTGLLTNPGAELVLEAGDVAVLLGDPDQVDAARAVLAGG